MKEAIELVGRSADWPSGGKIEIVSVRHWDKENSERIYLDFQIDGQTKGSPSGFIRIRGNGDRGVELKTEFGDVFFNLDGSKNGAAKKTAIARLFE
jgi:hypothetical protein